MKLILSIFVFFQIVFLINPINAANILFFFAVGTYSHRITVWPLVENLADRGHNVTFIQPYHPKKPNPKVNEFFPKEFQEYMKSRSRVTDGDHDLLNHRLIHGDSNAPTMVAHLGHVALKVCENFVGYKETVEFVKTAKFDLVILDGLFNECGLGFAHKFGAKVMIFGTTSLFAWNYDPFGVPVESSWISELHWSFQFPMSFIERIISTLIVPLNYGYRLWVYYPKLEEIMKKGLNLPDMPPIHEMEQNISLILLNTHFSEEFARSLPPFVVPVGGMHTESSVDLEKHLNLPLKVKEFTDESGDGGFIYVSFGSMAKISDAPPELQKTFYEIFRTSKTRFVWKWEGKRPAEMPDNVLTAEWMPQEAILSHPKIKAFITHGGLMSIQEAILSAVPMIVFPIFAEQDYNAFRIERTGRGIRLEIRTLTRKELQNAITEVLTNGKYKENMLKTSKLFKDRPQKAIDTAIWWTEYVLRHDDVSHLKPLSMYQTWYQRRLLDVWLIILLLGSSIIVIFYLLIKIMLKLLFSKSSRKVEQHSKNKKNK